MKTSIYKKTIFPAFVLCILSSCTHYIYISRSPWQTKSIIPDGKATEWTTPLKYYDEKSRLQYAVTNDNKNLYFCIRATEEETQTKILRAGMQIWIDTVGKNEHQVGILFPLSSALRKTEQYTAPKERSTGEKHDISGLKNKFLNGYKEMELSGFKPPINGMNPIQSSFGIIASINWDTIGIMTYEAVIPFKTFYKDSISASDSIKLMGISIVLNALPGQQGDDGGHGGGREGGGAEGMGGSGGIGGNGMGGGGMGSGGIGGGGMRGGGGHGGGNGGASQGSTYLFETNAVKKIFQLAVKK